MSLFKRRSLDFLDASQLVAADRSKRSGGKAVTASTALRHSGVWAAQRLRADLVSTMPVDIFRDVAGVATQAPKPPIFITPGGDEVDWCEWCYSTQHDLDGVGNTVGVITQRDGARLPSRIELVPFDSVGAKGKGATITEWRIGGEKHKPEDIWHEKQFTKSGLALGLSPIANAAMSIGGYLSAQEFARDWFAGGGIPSARFKNTKQTVTSQDAADIKQRFRATVGTGDVLVHGADWEYETIQAKASEAAFIEQMQFSITDICRFMGVPGDMIDADPGGSSLTYANITQRNLQLLIMNLNPSLRRREATFSRRLLPQPRYMRFNRAVILEMDLKSRYESYKIAIDSRWMVPSEVREIEDRRPLTPEQLAEFAIFAKSPTPTGGQPA